MSQPGCFQSGYIFLHLDISHYAGNKSVMSDEYAIFIFHPSPLTYEKTPFRGDRDEMLEVAEELQELALERGEKAIYVVRPLPYPPQQDG